MSPAKRASLHKRISMYCMPMNRRLLIPHRGGAKYTALGDYILVPLFVEFSETMRKQEHDYQHQFWDASIATEILPELGILGGVVFDNTMLIVRKQLHYFSFIEVFVSIGEKKRL